MGYRQLSFEGLLKEMEEASCGSRTRKFCFILGAGASRSSGIKTGQELVDIWDNELLIRNPQDLEKWKNELGITPDNKYGFYTHYYEERFERIPSDGYNFLEKLMDQAKPGPGYLLLALVLSKTAHNIVITTNFDHLIEDASQYYIQNMPLVIGHESLAHYIKKDLKRPTIVKIHRDLLLNPANRSNEVQTLHDNWQKALGIIFTDYHPIFIGYAGNDNSLMDFLLSNSDKFAKNEWQCPYWMLYGKSKLKEKVADFLEQSNGYCIQHGEYGFDEILIKIGALFKCTIAKEEDFIKDTRERYRLSVLKPFEDFMSKQFTTNKNIDSPIHSAATDAEGKRDVNTAMQKIVSQTDRQRIFSDAVSYHDAGEYENALQELQTLLEVEPDNPLYRNSLSNTLHAMKRYDEALDAVKEAVRLEPDNPSYHDSLSNTLHAMKRYDEALDAAKETIRLEPNDPSYHYSLGATLHAMKRYDEALDAVKEAVRLEPDNPSYRNSLGVTLYEMKRYNEALDAAKEAVKLEPDNSSYHSNLGVILHEMDRYSEALNEKQEALRLEPDNPSYRNSLSLTLHEMKRYDEAIDAAKEAVRLEPDNSSYHSNLGVILHEMDRYSEALNEKQEALRLEPDNPSYHDSLSTTLYAMQLHDEALDAAKKAVRLEPNNPSYHNSLSVTLHAMKQYDEALDAAKEAVKLEPDNPSYHYGLGVTLHAMKRYDEALNEKQEAIRLEPDNSGYRNSLDITLHAMKR